MKEGYRALRESAAWLDLSARGRISATGDDRARLLHAITTNQVEGLGPGEGRYCFFLNAQGRILADAILLVREDDILIDLEPEVRQSVHEHIDRYIIADDVTLQDVSESMAAIAIEGPGSADALRAMGSPVPDAAYSHVRWGHRTVAAASFTGMLGFRIYGPAEHLHDCGFECELAGIGHASEQDARIVRLECGKPRYGEDITQTTLPQETQIAEAVSFTKGCYLGQEIVERIRSRGHVNRLLVRLEWGGPEPETAPKLFVGGNEAGLVTSYAFSPALGKVVALGYARAQFVKPGAVFELEGGIEARVVA